MFASSCHHHEVQAIVICWPLTTGHHTLRQSLSTTRRFMSPVLNLPTPSGLPFSSHKLQTPEADLQGPVASFVSPVLCVLCPSDSILFYTVSST